MKIREQIECNDGFTVSVQASSGHYCSPRNDDGPYSHVELGYPSSAPIDSIIEYAEDSSDLCGTVYPYVPVQLVIDLLNAHGGPKVSQQFLE